MNIRLVFATASLLGALTTLAHADITVSSKIDTGLLTNNTAFVLQGGLIVGLFAVLIYDALVQLEARLVRRTGG